MVDILIMAQLPGRRDWLLESIAAEPSIRVAGIASTLSHLRSLISETSADLALIDLPSHLESGVIGDWLIELSSLVSILVFSSEPNPSVFNHILKQRTGGILPGDASSEQITQAVKSVALGLMVFDGALIQPPPPGSNDAELREALTPRETEVLNLLADGLGNREIAGRLDISEHTIKFHIRSILGKLGASSRTEAVSLGLRSGLIEL